MAGIGRKLTAVVATSAAITAGGLAIVGIADAQEPSGGAAGGDRPAFCDRDPAEWQAAREERRTEFVADLAAELQIDPAELQTAIRTVALDHLDERLADAVESGRLREQEADEIRVAAEDGRLRELLAERFPNHGRIRDRILSRVCG